MPQGEPTGISRAKEQVQRRGEGQNATTYGAGKELKLNTRKCKAKTNQHSC